MDSFDSIVVDVSVNHASDAMVVIRRFLVFRVCVEQFNKPTLSDMFSAAITFPLLWHKNNRR